MGNNNPSRRTEDWKLGADAPAACERCDATANVEYSEELGTTLCANCFRQSADERNAKHVAAIALSLPEQTDLGNAELFAQLYANRLRHVRERGKWLCWRDSRWQTDTSGEAERAAKATTKELLRRGAELEGERQEKVVKWGLASQSDARLRAMLNQAATEPEIVLSADALDADPYLLGVGNARASCGRPTRQT